MRLFAQLSWYFRREWRRYLGAVALLVIIAMLQLVPPKVVGIVVDGVTEQHFTTGQILIDAPRDKSPHIREINDTVAAFQYLQKNYNFMYQYQNSWSLKWVILAFEAIQSLVLTRD
ncbi:hypothetical protein OP417_001978 [Escherichia coli]|nr:hypothetical protein [Escherichia coli]